MAVGEDLRIQPAKIEAARLDVPVDLSALDHEIIAVSRDVVPADDAPRRSPVSHVRENREVAVDEEPALWRMKTTGQIADVGSGASAKVEDVQSMRVAERADDFTRQQPRSRGVIDGLAKRQPVREGVSHGSQLVPKPQPFCPPRRPRSA